MTATVGGTMVSRILGLSRWGGPLSAYFELTGEQDTTPRNAAMGRGLALEESVLASWAQRDGWLWDKGRRIEPFTMPHAHATLDAVAWRAHEEVGDLTLIDAKTASTHEMGPDWGPDGSDKIPTEYHLQLLWYMGVCRAAGMAVADEALLPTLCGPESELQWAARMARATGRVLALSDLDGTGLEVRVYRVAWDAALFADVDERVRRFLHDHVEPRVPPGLGDAVLERDARAVSRGLHAEPGRVLDFETLAPADQGMVLELLDANRQRKAWESVEEQAAVRVKVAMGTADEVRGLPGGARVTWRERQTGMRVFQVHEPKGRKT